MGASSCTHLLPAEQAALLCACTKNSTEQQGEREGAAYVVRGVGSGRGRARGGVRAWGEMQAHGEDFMCSPAGNWSIRASAILVNPDSYAPCVSSYEHGGACEVRSARRELNPKLPTWSRDGLEALPRLPQAGTQGYGLRSRRRAELLKAHGGQVVFSPALRGAATGRREALL